MANFFDIDWTLAVKRMLPMAKKSQWHIDWLYSIIKGIRTVYTQFITFKDDTLRQLSYNSQTLLLEKALNDELDSALERIYIQNDVDLLEESFCYFISEAQDDATACFLSESPAPYNYTYSVFEYNSNYDFRVYVPTALSGMLAQVRFIVDFYKLAGKRYLIILF